MTRTAARAGFERYVSRAIELTAEEFSVGNALRSTAAPSRLIDRLLTNSDRLRRRIVEPELDAYESRLLTQFDCTLDLLADAIPSAAAGGDSGESGATDAPSAGGGDASDLLGNDAPLTESELFGDDDPFAAAAGRVLEADSYYAALRTDVPASRRREIGARLVARQREFGAAIAPIVASDADAFWPAVRDAYDQAAAERVVTEQFRFSDPLEAYPDAFRFTTEFDPADVLDSRLLGSLPTVEVTYTDEVFRALDRAERRVIRETLAELREQYD